MTDTNGRRAPIGSASRRGVGALGSLFGRTDVAALAAFRSLVGLLVFATAVRFVAKGWVDDFFVDRTFFFKYWGLEWLPVAPASVITGLFVAMAVAGIGVSLGLFYRASVAVAFGVVVYVEAIDVTNYLNHYYLLTLLLGLLLVMPLGRAWSLDTLRRPEIRTESLPAWCTYLLRFQVGIVYFYAGLAKLGEDWLLHAQPLGIWLGARSDFPVLGPWLGEPATALAMSWAGFLFDTTIVAWLLWRRTRPFAYAVLVGFHALTGLLFNIGLFPLIMTAAALVFFAPSWPRRWVPDSFLRRLAVTERPSSRAGVEAAPPAFIGGWGRALGVGLLATYALVQIVVPLRHFAYPGDVLWAEQGMRWSWKVMVREKSGSITYHVTLPSGRVVQVSPRRYLTQYQEREMSGQPDLVLQLAHHVARDFRERGIGEVEVRAEAIVSLNGRAPRLMIDPTVDLTTVEDGLAPASWILPGPDEPPLRRAPSRLARHDG